jgi:fucose permease
MLCSCTDYLDMIVALGGWIVVFMTRVRGATAIAGSAAASGFWGGMTIGRLFLSFVTVRLGEFVSTYKGSTITILRPDPCHKIHLTWK